MEGEEATAGAAWSLGTSAPLPCLGGRGAAPALPRTVLPQDEVEILGREEGRCGRAREDHAAVQGMGFKFYINPCLALHNF